MSLSPERADYMTAAFRKNFSMRPFRVRICFSPFSRCAAPGCINPPFQGFPEMPFLQLNGIAAVLRVISQVRKSANESGSGISGRGIPFRS